MIKEEIELNEIAEESTEQAETVFQKDAVTDTEAVTTEDVTVTAEDEDEEEEAPEEERKVLFLKAAQGYGLILGFGVGYILSGLLSELGFQAGKFECVILCMFLGALIGYLLSRKSK